ncbi:hypothetical protein RCS94_09525 [Orbaceae bacterium ac157xtp]
MIAPSSYGALSATSANTIQGNKPLFTGQTDANKKKLGFKVGNISYSEANPAYNASTNRFKDKIESGTPKLFEPSLRLEDFKVQSLTANDFDVQTDYYDADGDEAETPAFTVGGVSHKWFDMNGVEITDETKMIGCGSGLNLPLTLKIDLSVQSHSQYGDPRNSNASGLEQSYQIKTTTSGICFVKPNSLDWFDSSGHQNTGSATPHPSAGGGYESTQFDPTNGFKASLNPKFPTTGFPGAEFALKTLGNVSDYTFTSNSEPEVTVNTNGIVRLNSKPSGAVTITATFINGTTHEYTFDPRTPWVVPKPGYEYYTTSKTKCGDESKLTNRAQLTNSPSSTGTNYNFFTRAVGGGVFGEWGYTTGGSSGTYPGSQWVVSYYWTRDPAPGVSTNYQFAVSSFLGMVKKFPIANHTFFVACLE